MTFNLQVCISVLKVCNKCRYSGCFRRYKWCRASDLCKFTGMGVAGKCNGSLKQQGTLGHKVKLLSLHLYFYHWYHMSELSDNHSALSNSATPWNVACQAPLIMGFSRQEYWSGLPCPPAGDLPNPGIKPISPALQVDYLSLAPPGKVGLTGECFNNALVQRLNYYVI